MHTPSVSRVVKIICLSRTIRYLSTLLYHRFGGLKPEFNPCTRDSWYCAKGVVFLSALVSDPQLCIPAGELDT